MEKEDIIPSKNPKLPEKSEGFKALIRDTDRLMRQLKLNEIWGRAHLRCHYRVASRWLLSLQQLQEFHYHLEQIAKNARKPQKPKKQKR